MWSITYRNQFGGLVTIGRWNSIEEAKEVAATIEADAEPFVHAHLPDVIDLVPAPQMSWPRYIAGGAVIVSSLTMLSMLSGAPLVSLQWLAILALVYFCSLGLDLCSAARRGKWPWEMQ